METPTKLEVGLFPGKLSMWTQLAIDWFKAGRPGDTIGVEAMTQHVGRDCQGLGQGRSNVNSALRHVLANYGIVWDWSRQDKLWKCLDDRERVDVVHRLNRQTHRRAGRSLKVAATIDETKLNDQERQEYRLATIAVGMVRLCGGNAFRKRLESSNGITLMQPDVGKLLELMKT